MRFDLDKCGRIFVVSPHLDDGVLSVGGIIERAAAMGADVVVGTAFTADMPSATFASALAEELHALWDLGPSPYKQRRKEDIQAVSGLGARVLHGQLLDALYRTDKSGSPLYPTRQSVFSSPSKVDEIGEALRDLYEGWIRDFAPQLVLSPLGVGRHVDHQLTTNAVRQVASKLSVPVALYEDMPSATGLFPVSAPDTVADALERTSWKVLEPQDISVSLKGKVEAIAAYASQIADIFPNGLEVGSVVDEYMRLGRNDGTYSERVWGTANSTSSSESQTFTEALLNAAFR
jgi:LmbE family N-acetylglucosaminyl deacetylase